MSKEKYCAMIDHLCEVLGVKDSKSRYDACHVEVNDVAFTVTYREQVDPDNVTIYCDFGEPPPELREGALLRVLETNVNLYCNNSPVFGINPETRHVILMIPAPISKLGIGSLVGIMVNVGSYVKLWRDKFFMTDMERDMVTALNELQARIAA
jgi:hypothetical protein